MNKQPVILMYQGIVTEWTSFPKEREAGAELYDVSTADFQDHLEWLRMNHYRVTTLGGFEESTSGKRVVLTFDDGEINNYDHALPLLRKYGFPAYFFVVADRIGRPGYMGWDELKVMHEAGMVIGSHGFSHGILTNLLDTQVEEELRASKRYLERNLNIEVKVFSVPGGFCNNKVIEMACEAGYTEIFITHRPRNLNGDCYSRMPVKANWDLTRFKQALDGEMPVRERMLVACRSAVKKTFGDGAYHWFRKTLLR